MSHIVVQDSYHIIFVFKFCVIGHTGVSSAVEDVALVDL